MSTYKLRPHHGLCLQFFHGEGYSNHFVENMHSIVKILETNPKIQLIYSTDIICIACPNHSESQVCSCEKKVISYDKKVLEICNLEQYSELYWNDYSHIIQSKILNPNLRETICQDCQWNQLCFHT